MRQGYYAVYAPGVTDIQICTFDGRGAGTYSCAPVVRAAALGPVIFAFLTQNGVFCIDAESHQTWSV